MAVGSPDFRKVVRPEKPFWGAGQNVAIYYSATALAGGANSLFTAFTVPAGYNFNLSSGVISSNVSSLNRVDYRPMGVLVTTFHYDTQMLLVDSDIGSAVFTAGQRLDVQIWNGAGGNATIYVALWGNLQVA